MHDSNRHFGLAEGGEDLRNVRDLEDSGRDAGEGKKGDGVVGFGLERFDGVRELKTQPSGTRAAWPREQGACRWAEDKCKVPKLVTWNPIPRASATMQGPQLKAVRCSAEN